MQEVDTESQMEDSTNPVDWLEKQIDQALLTEPELLENMDSKSIEQELLLTGIESHKLVEWTESRIRDEQRRSSFRLIQFYLPRAAVFLIFVMSLYLVASNGNQNIMTNDFETGGFRSDTFSGNSDKGVAPTATLFDNSTATIELDISKEQSQFGEAIIYDQMIIEAGQYRPFRYQFSTDTVKDYQDGNFEKSFIQFITSDDRSLPASFVMDRVNFPLNSSEPDLDSAANKQIDIATALLKSLDTACIRLDGYFDRSEDVEIDLSMIPISKRHDTLSKTARVLSVARANRACHLFKSRGIDKNRLGVGSYYESLILSILAEEQGFLMSKGIGFSLLECSTVSLPPPSC